MAKRREGEVLRFRGAGKDWYWGLGLGENQWRDTGLYLLTSEPFADLLVFVICGGIFVELIRLFF